MLFGYLIGIRKNFLYFLIILSNLSLFHLFELNPNNISGAPKSRNRYTCQTHKYPCKQSREQINRKTKKGERNACKNRRKDHPKTLTINRESILLHAYNLTHFLAYKSALLKVC